MQSSTLPPVVDVAWLVAHADSVVVADVRWYLDGRSGVAAFRSAHIPGAVFVDLERWLSGAGSPAAGRHPLPDPAVFAEGMCRAGISEGATVIAYDDAGGVIAARLVWMLRVTGHAAALLDGGIGAWTAALEPGESQPEPAVFRARPWPQDRLASIEEVAARVALVLDARGRDRYRGEGETVDPRAGHIPGAVSLPCRENLDRGGRFLPVPELRGRFEALGITGTTPVISTCGSGVTACHNLLALELVGLGSGRLFPGSWSQWSSDPSRPVAVGDQPG